MGGVKKLLLGVTCGGVASFLSAVALVCRVEVLGAGEPVEQPELLQVLVIFIRMINAFRPQKLEPLLKVS